MDPNTRNLMTQFAEAYAAERDAAAHVQRGEVARRAARDRAAHILDALHQVDVEFTSVALAKVALGEAATVDERVRLAESLRQWVHRAKHPRVRRRHADLAAAASPGPESAQSLMTTAPTTAAGPEDEVSTMTKKLVTRVTEVFEDVPDNEREHVEDEKLEGYDTEDNIDRDDDLDDADGIAEDTDVAKRRVPLVPLRRPRREK